MGRVTKACCTLALAGVMFVAGTSESEARKKKPAPAPAPAPVLEPIPYRPWIAEQPSATLTTPPKDASGVRQTINVVASPMQKSWNLRSAYNVAALNCRDPKYAAILVNYKAFLKKHVRGLTAVNRAVDAEFRALHGARYIAPREAYMTKVYNFYALPPTTTAFCNAALVMSEESKTAKVGALNAYSELALPKLDVVFLDFFNRYDQWKIDAAAWDARYAAMYLARYGVPAPGTTVASSTVASSAVTSAAAASPPGVKSQ